MKFVREENMCESQQNVICRNYVARVPLHGYIVANTQEQARISSINEEGRREKMKYGHKGSSRIHTPMRMIVLALFSTTHRTF